MLRFEVTTKDLGCLGWPMDIRKEVYIAYYNWVKEDKPIQEFKYTIERPIEYVDKFNKDWEWIR